MGLFTRGKVFISADRNTYLEYDNGSGLVTLYVEGVAVMTASNAAITMLAETLAGETVTGTLTAANVVVQTAFTALAANITGTARLLGNNQIGASTASKIGLYGATPIGQPAATAQGAVGTGAASGGLMVTATALNNTTGVIAGFQNVGQVTALIQNFNNLVSQVDATGGLLHAIRTALIQLGGIKGTV